MLVAFQVCKLNCRACAGSLTARGRPFGPEAVHGRGTSELFPPPLAVAAFLLVLPLLLIMGWRIVAVAIHRVFVHSVVAAAPLLP